MSIAARHVRLETVKAESRGLEPELAELDEARPRTRGDCENGPRPCPWVACKHHLYLDVNPDNGTIKLVFPTLQPEEMVRSCALDVADEGEHTLEAVGELMNVTRERVRQMESRATRKLLSVRVIRDADDGNAIAPHHEHPLA